MTWTRGWSLVLFVGFAISASGCMALHTASTRARGTLITKEALEQVTPGETTREGLVAVFGHPTTVKELPDGGELLKYEYTQRRNSNLAVLVLFAGHEDVVERRSVACFAVRDGIVQRRWLEE